MQTGGLLRTSRSARRCSYTASLFADTRPVDEVLERAGIAELADRRVGKCSGGEQQRLRFAMALLSDPRAAGPRRAHHRHGRRGPPRRSGRRSARDAERGRTVLFATHYLEEADQYADRIVLIARAGSSPTAPTGDQGPGPGRTVRATLENPDHQARWPASRASSGWRCAATRSSLHGLGHRRDRPLPAHPHRRPGPGTRPGHRGGVPVAHRRRRPR